MITRMIPSTGEALPVIGLGTWQTFDVAPESNTEKLQQVLTEFETSGARLIDSSPMYGRSEDMIGRLTSGTRQGADFFYATKVWTTGKAEGIRQMEESFRRFRRPVIDLMQIHNLVDWKTHLETLRAWKEEGRIRYIGITHYTDEMHGELEKIIATVPLDFVQFNYSIFDRHAEGRLLPAAAHHGVATLINRPLGVGKALEQVRGKSLPAWAQEYGIESWSQYFLKFLISHPAVTCVIPATGNPAHMSDNLKAGSGTLPDAGGREKMGAYLAGM
jgi:diketogulonate reductase-like aldo/keto reductase